MRTYLQDQQKEECFQEVEQSDSDISVYEKAANEENFSNKITNNYSCINCFQNITNPICTRCYTKHIKLWLEDNRIEEEIINQVMLKIRDNVGKEDLNELDCIICGNEAVSLCTYCYFFKIESLLIKFNFSDSLIQDFQETFNYKLYRIKYF